MTTGRIRMLRSSASSSAHRAIEDRPLITQEAEALNTLLENDVIPEFYEREERGLPLRWVRRVRESMRGSLRISATHAIREYTEDHYLPAASGYHERAASGSKVGAGLLKW
jgi:glycogen phosphorylase